MIHLVHMPFGSITRPPLALSVLKAQLRQAGVGARVFHFNLAFAKQIQFGPYEMLARWKGAEPHVGEWLFAEHAWGRFGPSEDDFFAQCGPELQSLPVGDDPRAWLRKLRRQAVPVFVEACVRWLRRAAEPKVVVFGCTVFQTVPALALGRRLKEVYPNVKLVYGGACFQGEQGDELIRKAPWIDAVSLGEADDVRVPLVRALAEHRAPEGLHGVLWRDGSGAIQAGPPARPVSADVLNALPPPDFDDFFEDARQSRLTSVPGFFDRVFLPFESARGCGWGEAHHGAAGDPDAEGTTMRRYAPERVQATLQALVSRYAPVHRLHAIDDHLSPDAFNDLVPWLARRPLGPHTRLYYRVKANLSRAQIEALSRAGIAYIQPDIDSLATGVLAAMRKGVTGIQNVFFLKVCRELGVIPFWSLLVRVPGEQPQDYARMADWIPKIMHLFPPLGGAPPVECHRFSPFFPQADRWTTGVRPMPWYNALYPAERVDLARVAHHFEADWKDVLPPKVHEPVVLAIIDWLRVWTESPELPMLVSAEGTSGSLYLTDTRGERVETFSLNAANASAYRAIAEPASVAKVCAHLERVHGAAKPEAQVRAALDEFVRMGIALEEDGTYLALALPPTAVELPLEARQNLARPAVVERSGVQTHAGLD